MAYPMGLRRRGGGRDPRLLDRGVRLTRSLLLVLRILSAADNAGVEAARAAMENGVKPLLGDCYFAAAETLGTVETSQTGRVIANLRGRRLLGSIVAIRHFVLDRFPLRALCRSIRNWRSS